MLCLTLKNNSSFMEETTYKNMVQKWTQKWLWPLICQHLHCQNRERDPRQSPTEPLVGKRYIDDVYSLWNAIRDKIESLFERSVKDFDSTIKFTSEISETTINILGHESVQTRESIIDVQNGTL